MSLHSNIVNSFKQTFYVKRITKGETDKSSGFALTTSTTTREEAVGIIQPLSAKGSRYIEEGTQLSNYIVAYCADYDGKIETPLPYNHGDIIGWMGCEYRITQIEPWSSGGYIKYICIYISE